MRTGWVGTTVKRTFAVAGLCYTLAMVAACLAGFNVAAVLGVLLGAAAVVLLCVRKTRRARLLPAAVVAAAAACGVFCVYTWSSLQPVWEDYTGTAQTVEGQVTRVGKSANGAWYMLLDMQVADGSHQVGVRLYGDCAAETEPGDWVRAAARFFEEEPSPRDLSGGILLNGYADTLLGRAEPESTPLWLRLRHANDRLTESIKTAVPGWRGDAVAALSIAGGDPLPYEVSRDFSRSGVAHLLSLSGMHLSIVSFLMLAVLRRLRLPDRAAYLVNCAALVGYMALVGLRPSVLRAGVMLLVYYLGLTFGRQRDSLNSLGFAALVVVNINPYNALDGGFLLSFSATLGILLFQPKICLLLEKALVKCRVPCAKLHVLVECMAVTVSAVFLSAPVAIPAFGQISLVGFFVNLIAAFLAPVIIGCGLLCALTGLVPFLAFASNGLGFVAGLCVWAMRKICGFCAWLPFAVMPAGMEFVYLWLGGSLILFGVCVLCFKRWRQFLVAGLLSICCLLTGFVSNGLVNIGVTRLSAVSVQGGALLVLSRGSHAAVIGDVRTSMQAVDVDRLLRTRGIDTVDLLLVPPGIEKSASAAAQLADYLRVDTALAPAELGVYDALESIPESSVSALADGMSLTLWEDVRISVHRGPEGAVLDLLVDRARFVYTTGRSEISEGGDAQALFVCGLPPEGVEKLRAQNTVYGAGRYNPDEAARAVASGSRVCFVPDGGAVTVMTRGAGDCKLKGGF